MLNEYFAVLVEVSELVEQVPPFALKVTLYPVTDALAGAVKPFEFILIVALEVPVAVVAEVEPEPPFAL